MHLFCIQDCVGSTPIISTNLVNKNKLYMKKFLTTFVAIGTALSLLTGCATINNLTPVQITRIGTVITLVADQGAVYAIQQDGRNAAYFKAAIPVLNNFANGTDLSPAALQLALSNTSLGTNQWVGLVVGAVVVAYDVSYSQYISNQLTNVPAAKIWITDVAVGFQQALVQTGTGLKLTTVIITPDFIVKGKVDETVIKAKVNAAGATK